MHIFTTAIGHYFTKMSSQKQRQFMLITGLVTYYCYFINIPSAGATLLAVNKGWCLTYDQSSPGTLVTFSRCRSSDSRQNSWQLLNGPRSTTVICISGSQQLCAGLGINGRMVLMIRNPFLLSQQWRKISRNRLINALSGPNFCAQAIENISENNQLLSYFGRDFDWMIPPRYIGMRPCSDSYQQMVLNVSFDARASYKNYHLRNAVEQ